MPKVANHHSRKIDHFNISQNIVNSCFDKKFTYIKELDWKLPSTVEHLFSETYNIEYLQELKIELNCVKSKLNDYPIEEWSAHTGRRNPAGNIAGYLKNKIKAEFVTQAWCKFYECLHQYPIVSEPDFCSVHLCEAPGAFIASLNHYLHSSYSSVEWKWLATTLNPYYEENALSNMVADDRFMLHTLDRWMFGIDFTGNIINKANIEDMACRSAQMGDVSLVTADGSIDCMENPDSQEETVLMLHYAEICAALKILSEGGSLVLKTFTLFETSSVCFMYLLNCIFREINVYKPATSKCGNSETYVVCIGFCKNTPNFKEIYDAMLHRLEYPNLPPIFPKSCIPENFLDEHITCVKFFMTRQVKVIESNIKAYEKKNPHDIRFCQTLRSNVCDEYLKKYKIRQLPIEHTILFDKQATIHYEFHKKIYTGSYTARSLEKLMSLEEKIEILQKQLKEFEEQIIWPYPCKEQELGCDEKQLKINRSLGNPITSVRSSLFAHLHLMHLRRKISSIGMDISPLCEHKSRSEVTSDITKKTVEITPCNSGFYSRDEKDFLKMITFACLELKATKIVFQNVLFLTHFSVSFIRHLWSDIFMNLIVSKNHEIILEGLKDDGTSKLQELVDEFEVPNLLCLIDIKELHKNAFSDAVFNHNNALLLSSCREKLVDIKKLS